MKAMRPCLDCGRLSYRTRCPAHPLIKTAQRGYGGDHQRARAGLQTMLPAPCAYGCGAWLTPSGDWVAAHVVDGDPSAGWVASCRSCNERAKRSRQAGWAVPQRLPNRDFLLMSGKRPDVVVPA